ncbi:hypothetical protein, partial [Rothia dentocariosa]|uniref:hypothetical protein n=1 Tax=Rothia dentocariosa TaxID=2047 RepID=UPI001C54C08F
SVICCHASARATDVYLPPGHAPGNETASSRSHKQYNSSTPTFINVFLRLSRSCKRAFLRR